MTISFKQKMLIPEHEDHISQNETVDINGTAYPVLKIEIMQG